MSSGEERARVKKSKTLMQSDFHPLEDMLFSPDVFLTGSSEISQARSSYDNSKRGGKESRPINPLRHSGKTGTRHSGI